jgi:hypothetical protein
MLLTEQFRRTARTGARTVATSLGQLSADLRMRPSFLVAGAQRRATPRLFRMLAQHPQVRPPVLNKGIHYFDTAERFRRGPRFYAAHFPLRHAADAITGEASPYYLFHPLAAARIAEQLESVKIIVLLRDPAERAFSAHKQEQGRGFESLHFEEALAAEPERLAGEEERIMADPAYQSFAHQHHAYQARGRYAGQLERMFAAVGREQVLVLDADDFFVPGLPHWDRLLEHLGLPDWRPPAAVHTNARPSKPMPQRLRRQLRDDFADDDERLAELLGETPSWRR